MNNTLFVCVCAVCQRHARYHSDSDSGALVQRIGIQTICFGVVNGQAAASSGLPLRISLRHLCTAYCLLNIFLITFSVFDDMQCIQQTALHSHSYRL